MTDWLVPNSLMLAQVVTSAGNGQTLTVEFSSPVSSVQFSISDIDANWADSTGRIYGTSGAPCGYRDNVQVSATGATITAATRTSAYTYLTVTGSGTSSVLAASTRGSLQVGDATDAGWGVVDYKICGPISSFTVKYTNSINNTAVSGWSYMDQQVYISPLVIQPTVCICT